MYNTLHSKNSFERDRTTQDVVIIKTPMIYMVNTFLNYTALNLVFICHHIPHDYTNIRQVLNIQTLFSRRDNADLEFLSDLLNDSIDVPDLLSVIPFRIRSHLELSLNSIFQHIKHHTDIIAYYIK